MIRKEKVAGIDVHKMMLAVVVGGSEQPETEWKQRKFGTTRAETEHLRCWLEEQGVREVAMESTAQYWKPIWLTLEGHFQLHLAQARSTTGPKGRKTDFRDAVRIVKRLLSDDLTLSYVPEPEQRRWRMLTRGRHQLTRERTRLHSQIEALLEEGQIKLSCVVSDLLGVSGYRILRALERGEADPGKLAELADPRLRVSPNRLQEAVDGQMHEQHRVLLRLFLNRLDLVEQQMEELGKVILAAMQVHQEAITRLSLIPGLGIDSAHQMIAELGPEAGAFASAGQCCSWVGVCPGRQESAGVSTSNRCPKGNPTMRRLLNQAAWASAKTKDSHFQHLFRRLVPRLGVKKAIVAVAHHLLKVIWKILHHHVAYQEFGPLATNELARNRRKQKLLRELRRLGYTVHVNPAV
jgi:transposase